MVARLNPGVIVEEVGHVPASIISRFLFNGCFFFWYHAGFFFWLVLVLLLLLLRLLVQENTLLGLDNQRLELRLAIQLALNPFRDVGLGEP